MQLVVCHDSKEFLQLSYDRSSRLPDTCMTSIFSSSWMCRLCGREACSECFAKVRELTQYRQGASDSEIAALQAKRESHAHTNPFFLSCTRRNEHQYSDFSPMSRFDKAELEGVIESMEKLLEEETVRTSGPAIEPSSSSDQDGALGVTVVAARASVPVCHGGPSIKWPTSDDSTYRILQWMWRRWVEDRV